MHVALLVALSTGDHVPAAHCVHKVAPADDQEPAAHGEHDVAPADDQKPAAQLWHVEGFLAPSTVDDVPAAHCVHKPAPTADQEPAGQVWHDVAPGAGEKEPATQL